MSNPTRECGPCSACCSVMAVHELEKRAYEVCAHLCGTGCGIYADRPESCRTFACQWLRGVLEVDGIADTGIRPDSCGVIFDYQPDTAFGEVYTAWEVEPGAVARGAAKDIVSGLAERFLVVVMMPEPGGRKGRPERTFLGPPHLVSRAADAMWSRPADPGPTRRL